MIKEIINNYKNNEITIYEAAFKLDQYRNEKYRKSSGIVYTPKSISDYIISIINYDITETILEPSVGHGVFIFSLIEYVENNFNLSNEELKNWFENKVFGMDIVESNIEDLKILINLYFEKKGIYNISTNNFIIADTLFFDFDRTFDCIIGNPPYIRTKNLEEDYLKSIRNKFFSCEKGNIDIYYAFIELGFNLAKKVSFITPNSYIYNKSANNLRQLIFNDIHSIIDFKNELIFENVGTYTSIFNIDRTQHSDEILYKNSLVDQFLSKNKNDMDHKHWLFGEDNLGKQSINDLTDVKSGIATLRDKVFIINNSNEILIDNVTYYKHTYDKKEYLIEKDICVDFHKITKQDKQFKIIFPYDSNHSILEESLLASKYPKSYAFLLEVKEELNKRDKGKVEKYEAWYAYGRKQGFFQKNKEYYLLVPIMMSEDSNCQILNYTNEFLFTSGFVLGFDSIEELNLVRNNIESEHFFNYIRTYGKPWAGKKEYYSFTISLLKNFKF